MPGDIFFALLLRTCKRMHALRLRMHLFGFDGRGSLCPAVFSRVLSHDPLQPAACPNWIYAFSLPRRFPLSTRFTGGGVPKTARAAAFTTLVARNFFTFFFAINLFCSQQPATGNQPSAVSTQPGKAIHRRGREGRRGSRKGRKAPYQSSGCPILSRFLRKGGLSHTYKEIFNPSLLCFFASLRSLRPLR